MPDRTVGGAILSIFLLAASPACSGEGASGSSDAGEWRHETTVRGDTTLVRTLSGSIWEGRAEPVEIARVGVDEGEEWEMLGDVPSIALDESRLYVLDKSVPTVRVYGLDGAHRFSMGRSGEGPGEFGPYPSIVAVAADGRVFVREPAEIEVFDPSGQPLASWPEPGGGIALPMMVSPAGVLLAPTQRERNGEFVSGHLPIGPDGTAGDLMPEPAAATVDWRPWQLEARGERTTKIQLVPYWPRTVWTRSPSGAVITAATDRYQVRVKRPDGTVTMIERQVDPVPVGKAEARWLEDTITARMRSLDPSWIWDANPIPEEKSLITDLYTDSHDRVWVRRIAGTTRIQDCAAASPEPQEISPCWYDIEVLDVFRMSGEFLGELRFPEGVRMLDVPAIHGDRIAILTQTETGVIQVRVFEVRARRANEQR